MTATHVQGSINGAPYEDTIANNALLLDFLRSRRLTGAKPSCELEVCGSCTVLLEGKPVSSCTTLAVELDGKNVETVEGLSQDGVLHPVQQAFVEEFAFQCGYCTPGMIMSVKALLAENSDPAQEEIMEWLDGNICRCTGYVSIIRATQKAARVLNSAAADESDGSAEDEGAT